MHSAHTRSLAATSPSFTPTSPAFPGGPHNPTPTGSFGVHSNGTPGTSFGVGTTPGTPSFGGQSPYPQSPAPSGGSGLMSDQQGGADSRSLPDNIEVKVVSSQWLAGEYFDCIGHTRGMVDDSTVRCYFAHTDVSVCVLLYTVCVHCCPSRFDFLAHFHVLSRRL